MFDCKCKVSLTCTCILPVKITLGACINKTDCHEITEILLNVTLNTKTPNLTCTNLIFKSHIQCIYAMIFPATKNDFYGI